MTKTTVADDEPEGRIIRIPASRRRLRWAGLTDEDKARLTKVNAELRQEAKDANRWEEEEIDAEREELADAIEERQDARILEALDRYAKILRPGRRFECLVLLRLLESDPKQGRRWLCRCDCGNEKAVLVSNLNSGRVVSCGCVRAELQARFRAGETPACEILIGDLNDFDLPRIPGAQSGVKFAVSMPKEEDDEF